MTDVCHIDTFTSGLDDLSKRRQSSTREVLRHLARAGMFSVFEATDNDVIAATVDRVLRKGLLETTPSGFPWTKVTLTDAGRAVLANNDSMELAA